LIRGVLKGHHLDIREVSDEFMYWFFAHHFKYTQDQVDQIPYDRMVYLIELEQEFNKLNQQTKKDGRL